MNQPIFVSGVHGGFHTRRALDSKQTSHASRSLPARDVINYQAHSRHVHGVHRASEHFRSTSHVLGKNHMTGSVWKNIPRTRDLHLADLEQSEHHSTKQHRHDVTTKNLLPGFVT